MTEPQDNEMQDNKPNGISRRKFLKNTGYVLGGAVLGGVLGSLVKRTPNPAAPAPGPGQAAPPTNYNRALMHFTPDQFAMVEAATERIFPADDHGPGAKDLGVPFFIDHQLGADWGFNAREYMRPPFYAGEKVQGYQGRLSRREIFNIALREMDNYSMATYNNTFISLTPEQQIEVLKAFETDQVKLTTISASGFFRMLRSSTLEGTYSDPLYGGNANMDGWKMRSYPGNRMSYTDVIDKDFTNIPPASLQDHMTGH